MVLKSADPPLILSLIENGLLTIYKGRLPTQHFMVVEQGARLNYCINYINQAFKGLERNKS